MAYDGELIWVSCNWGPFSQTALRPGWAIRAFFSISSLSSWLGVAHLAIDEAHFGKF